MQPPPKSPCSVLLATFRACLANCSKLFKLLSGQKAIFINLTSPSFLVFTVSLGFPPGEPLAWPALPLAGPRHGPAGAWRPSGGPAGPTAGHGLPGAAGYRVPATEAGVRLWRAVGWQSLGVSAGTQDGDPLVLGSGAGERPEVGESRGPAQELSRPARLTLCRLLLKRRCF